MQDDKCESGEDRGFRFWEKHQSRRLFKYHTGKVDKRNGDNRKALMSKRKLVPTQCRQKEDNFAKRFIELRFKGPRMVYSIV